MDPTARDSMDRPDGSVSSWSVRWGQLALVLAVFFGNSPVFGEAVTPNDVARLKNVESAHISPDGKSVAYVVNQPRQPMVEEDGSAWRELHVLRADGSSRPYVFGQQRVSAVDWTPDGSEITFLTKRGDDKETSLYAIPLDGGEAFRVLAHSTSIEEYSFSPDGKQLAFLAKEPTPKALEELRKKGFQQEIFEEDVRAVRVWVMTLGSEGSEPSMFDLEGSASLLNWSPSGELLSVGLQPQNLVDQSYTSRKIHLVDAASGESLASLANPGKLGHMEWSPDGKHLAFQTALDQHDPSAGRLAVVSASGGDLEYLLPDGFAGDAVDFTWEGNKGLLAILAEGTQRSVYQISLKGNLARRVGPGQGCWTEIGRGKDSDSIALVGTTPQHPAELYRGTLTGGVEKVTDHNPWLADLPLARQEVVKYKTSDGDSVEGIFIHPLKAPVGGKSPLVVHVHGGPESHYCNGWMTNYNSPGQMAAAKGFAVFAPNYRGSTGRGVAFAKAHQADPAGREFEDIVEGIDFLVEKRNIDRDRVGVVGGSYGGFAAAWAATYFSERYAAAVMFVGISNHISKSGTTDIPDEIYLVHQRKRIWEDWQLFLERSPIYYVEKARTPTLILGGTDDTRVHPGQSLELYRALKSIQKAPVRYVRYPGEKHGNNKAAARYDYSLRMLRWFDHYLLGDTSSNRSAPPPPHELDYAGELGIEEDTADD